MLSRDLPFPVVALEESLLATCSELLATGESTAPGVPLRDTTDDVLISTGDIGDVDNDEQGAQVSTGGIATKNGRIIDRLRYPLGSHYNALTIQPFLTSTRGSTEADRKLALGIVLQQGDSSGGGDMAEYSTGSRPSDRIYFTSARTSDMENWDDAESSGPLYAVGNPGTYDLRGAGRYVRVQVRAGKNSVTTESSGDEQCRVGAIATFHAGDDLPPNLDTTSPLSTSTST